MNRHVSNTVLPRKKASLWTPWGLQRVPDLDEALEGEQAWHRKREEAEPVREMRKEELEPASR